MRRALALLAALVTAVAATLVVLVPASAQEAPSLAVRQVDATDPASVDVTFTYAGDRSDLSGLVLREDGALVDTTTAVPLGDQQALGIVLAIDVSGSMQQGALIERVLDAARRFIAEKAVSDQIAIVTFSGEVRLVQDFTTDEAVLTDALDDIALAADTSLYDGIVRSAALFEGSELQPNIVVFSDGADSTSVASAERARGAVDNVGGALFAIGVDNPGFDSLRDIAGQTGGTAAVAGDPSGVEALFDAVQETLRKQYVVSYPSQAEGGTVGVTLTVGNQQVSAEFVSGSEQHGAAALRPQPVEEPSGPAFLRTSTGLVVAVLMAALAAVLATFALGSTFFGRGSSLDDALEPYSEGYVPSGGDEERAAKPLVQTALLRRAVAATGELADRQGQLRKVEALLDKANLPLRPAEAIFVFLATVGVVALLLLGLTQDIVATLVGAAVVALVPPAVISYLGTRRRKQFEALLPDTLQLLASTLRAGYSLMQGVEAVSQEVAEPMGRELRRVVTEARLGRPVEESLEGIAERMESDDFAWAVMAIRIQREVGGNLSELLVTVADTMTERERLRRDVTALTAEGRISAIVLGILPLGLGFFIFTLNPAYMDPLFQETVGRILLGGSVLLALFGFWWMKKTIDIEI